MPNCFQLTRKADMKAGPVPLATIDNELCAHLGVKPDNHTYYKYWFDVIGFALACGKTFAELSQRHAMDEYKPIVEWLDNNFTSNAWAEIGRR